MNVSFLRLFTMPALSAGQADELRHALQGLGTLLGPHADPDLDCTVTNLRLSSGDAQGALERTAGSLKTWSVRHVLRVELQGRLDDADVRACERFGATLAQQLDVATYTAHRTVPSSQWLAARPLAFGVDGFSLRGAPTQARANSNGAAVLEFGEPTILIKVKLNGVPASALQRICDATGNARGGLLHIGAAPGISVKTGEPIILLECSDPAKSPVARALELIAIEARRYGGALGANELLSFVPLDVLLQTLSMHMPLEAQPSQIIETHLGGVSR